MGLFSSKKKHFVDTQVQRVVEDSGIPEPNKEALVDSILTGTNITNSILDRSFNGGYRQFESMYRWAEANYYYGLPDITLHTAADGNAHAEAQIEAEVGVDVTIEYLYYRPLNNVHAGMKYLTDSLGYDHSSNEIVSLHDLSDPENPRIRYLDKLVAVHETATDQEPEATAIGTMDSSGQVGQTPEEGAWDVPADLSRLTVQSEVRVGPAETESVEIHTIWENPFYDPEAVPPVPAPAANSEDPSNEHCREVLVYALTGYDQDREYYQAKYTEVLSGDVGYWIYDTETGTNTDLNTAFDVPAAMDPGTYFPFTVFRSEGQNRADPQFHNTTAYDSTVKLLEHLDMDFQEIADAMHDGANEIHKVDQAVMMMAVPITTQDEVEIDYLFRYFEDLASKLPADAQKQYGTSAGFSDGRFGGFGGAETSYAMTLSDADFEMKISFDSLTYRVKAGTVGTGAIGEVQNTTSQLNSILAAAFNNDRVVPGGVEAPQERYIRKQLNEHVYGEIKIKNIRARYRIYRDKAAEAGHRDDRLMIPLDFDICQSMSPFDRERLYYRSLHFVFNSHVVQKIKWYQTGVFAAVLAIIAVVLMFTTGFGAEFWAAIQAGGTVLANFIVTKIIFGIILKGILFNVAFSVLADIVGVENALILAVIAGITGFVSYFKSGMVWQGTAGNLLQASTSLIKGAQEALVDEFDELMTEMQEFREWAEEVWADLEEKNKLLDSGVAINPFAFVGEVPMHIWGESSEAYYYRTIHAGNPGVASLKIIQNYHDISLTLPSLTDTLGLTENYERTELI